MDVGNEIEKIKRLPNLNQKVDVLPLKEPKPNTSVVSRGDNSSPDDQSKADSSTERSFRNRVVDKYNWYLNLYGGLVNNKVQIYEIPGFTGDWKQVSPEDYFVYRLSVKGIKPLLGLENVTEDQLNAVQAEDAEVNRRTDDALRGAVRAFYRVEDDSMVEKNNIIRVTRSRMNEFIRHTSAVAGAFRQGAHIGIMIELDSTKDLAELSAEVAHELGHFERMKSGKDDSGRDSKMIRLEEGIVQLNARQVAERGGFAKAAALGAYTIETSIAKRLAEKLKIDLMGFSHQEIAQLMKLSPSLNNFSDNPYQFLIENQDAYVSAVMEVASAQGNLSPQRLQELKIQFQLAEANLDKVLGKQ